MTFTTAVDTIYNEPDQSLFLDIDDTNIFAPLEPAKISLGTVVSHEVVVTENNIPPTASIQLLQNGSVVSSPEVVNGTVSLDISLNDINGDTVTLNAVYLNDVLLMPDLNGVYSFDPSTEPSTSSIRVEISDNGTPLPESATQQLDFNIVPAPAADSGGGGGGASGPWMLLLLLPLLWRRRN